MKTHQFLTNIDNGTKVVSIVVIGIVVFEQHKKTKFSEILKQKFIVCFIQDNKSSKTTNISRTR